MLGDGDEVGIEAGSVVCVFREAKNRKMELIAATIMTKSNRAAVLVLCTGPANILGESVEGAEEDALVLLIFS